MAKSKKAVTNVPAEAPEVHAPIVSVKGFDKNLSCRDFKFEIGKTYSVSGLVKACENGFHACEYPLDCFGYYAPAESRFCEVTQTGEISRDGSDTKIASATITIGVELSIGDIVARAVRWIMDRAVPEKGSSATGYQGAASATGYRGAASATGDQGAASATGYRGAASATGYRGAASATGYQGAASATGDQGAASATGDRGAASATGYQGAASATGKKSCAHAFGYEVRALGVASGAISIVSTDLNGNILAACASKVGENGIKPNTWYRLSADGQFEEVV